MTSPRALVVLRSALLVGVAVCAAIGGVAGRLIGQASEHWAYRPIPARIEIPESASNGVAQTRALAPIDAMVRAGLAERGLPTASRADDFTLQRRVYFALTGLPPTAADVARLAAGHPLDVPALVERLLVSPQHAEHMARHWLDRARYADTKGYEADRTRHGVWLYRDWVIDAYARDLRYDRFVIEQLAGDLLPDATIEQQIATAFHRHTKTNDEGGTDDEEFRNEAVHDRIETTFQVFLATSLACARCHDHKHDPITQREYYELFAFFDQTADADREDEAPLLTVPGTAAADRPADVAALPVLVELPVDQRRTSRMFASGSFLSPGDVVTPATPAFLPPLLRVTSADSPPNRLDLAHWIVGESNPLAARVAANHLWQVMFGRGLVARSEDFGTQGDVPSQPHLLDWLARELIANDWSVRALLRTIATSETFAQSAFVPGTVLAADPHNEHLTRGPRLRLAAEELRDAALAACGLLATETIGGPSVMPHQPPGIWKMVYSGESWQTSAGRDRHRRGLYTFWRRTAPYPTFVTFDAPSREVCVSRRPHSNTPLQALALLNDPAFVECAEHLARTLTLGDATTAPCTEFADFVGAAYQRALSRKATDDEITLLRSLAEREREAFAARPETALSLATAHGGPLPGTFDPIELAVRVIVCNVILNLDEFVSR